MLSAVEPKLVARIQTDLNSLINGGVALPNKYYFQIFEVVDPVDMSGVNFVAELTGVLLRLAA